MRCIHIGNFDESHICIKKRRVVGSAKTVAIHSILNKSISSETYREREVELLIQIGTYFLFYYTKC